MNLNIIFACNENGVIGKDNKMLWHIKDDLSFFKHMTTDCVVIMGRKTFESLESKPLPNRVNIVVSSSEYDNVYCAKSLDNAINIAKTFNKNIFVIGGVSLIEEALKYANAVYRTLVDFKSDGVKVSRTFEEYLPCLLNKTFNKELTYTFSAFVKNEDELLDKAKQFVECISYKD